MLIEEALLHLLQQELAAVYPGAAPENAKPPYIIYSQIGGAGHEDLNGATGLETPIFQIDVYAEKALTAKTLGKQIKTRLRNFNDVVSVGEAAIEIRRIHYQGGRDGLDNTAIPHLFRVTQDFQITYVDT